MATGDDYMVENYGTRWRKSFIPPVPSDPPARPRPISRLAMLKRFTDVERKRIRAQAARNEDVQDWLELFNAAQEIRLDDPDTMAGVQSLEAAGLLSPGRAAEILSA